MNYNYKRGVLELIQVYVGKRFVIKKDFYLFCLNR